MGRSIIELERSLHGKSGPRERKPARPEKAAPAPSSNNAHLQTPASAIGPASMAINRALAARPSARGYGLGSLNRQLRTARAFSAIDVAADGVVGPLRQANAMTCWATVYTMLANWKHQRSDTVENAIAAVGARWSSLLAQGATRGLSAAEKVDFLADAGLVALPPQNPMLQTWADMIRDYGPIWVTTDEQPPNLFIHARVLLSMRGDGTPAGTKLRLIDPGTGTIVTESFQRFLEKFEAEAGNPSGVLRVQIVHWPAGARAFSLVRPFTAIDVAADGIVGPLRQANAMTCWATVYTMLANWKNQRSDTVENAIAAVGPRWSGILAQGATRGLSAAEKVDFLAEAGLVALPPQNPMLQTWADMIRDYGPIWVTTDEGGQTATRHMIHARLLLSIRGDGSPDGTQLTFVNPSTGTTVTESFARFLAKFEKEVADPRAGLRVQIVHWPAGARAMSLGRPRGLNVPGLLNGTARRALIAALTDRGVPPAQAEGLVATFEAEIRAESMRPIPLSLRSDMFQATVPSPDGDGDPTQTAREILEFFYPGRSFASITDDHVRLAARMFYAALETQRLLNLLPDVPTTPPGPSWLARQAIKILWRQVRGPRGISVMTRNSVARNWRTTLEEIENGLPPTALGFASSPFPHAHVLSYVEQQGISDWINNPDIPLSPAVGGMSLDHNALEIADIIVSTTTEAPSIAIRRIGSPVSHVMLYVGGGMVVEAVGAGVVHRPLTEALAHSFVGVAFRHPNLTSQQGLIVRDYVGQRIGSAYDYDLILAHAKFQLGRMICEQLPESQRQRCLNAVGPVDIGAGRDGRFICSSLVAEAFASAGAPLLPIPARATNPGDIALSTSLVYLGHVKYDPPANLAERLRRI